MPSLDNIDAIRTSAKALLLKADVMDQLPTPVDELVAAAGLVEDADYEINESLILQMPRFLQRHLRSAKRKVHGIIDRRERIIQVDSSLNAGRRKFVKLHEVTHDILPWQSDLAVLAETSQTLLPSMKLRFEQEANQGAAELFFQLDFLRRVARDYPLDRTTPIELKNLFGSSIHAAFRNWVSSHDGCACGFVLSKKYSLQPAPSFNRLECIPTNAWEVEFGDRVFPRTMPVANFSFLGTLIPSIQSDIDAEWTVDDLNCLPRSVRVQSFTNGYNYFVLVWVPQRESFVARIRKTPKIVSPPTQIITSF